MPLIRATRWALAATAAAMPLYVVEWHVGWLTTTVLEGLVALTISLYVLTLWRHREPLPRRTPYDIPIAAFLIAGVIAIFVAPNHDVAAGAFRQYLVEPILLFYIATAILETTAAIELLLAAWGAGAVLFALINVATFSSALVTGTLQPGHAAAAFGINPNTVALYIEPLIGVATGLAFFGQWRYRRAAAGVLSVLLLAELSTLSRGGLLALSALALIAVLTLRMPIARMAVAGASALGALAVWQLPIIGPRVANSLDPDGGTLAGRERIWAATFRMLHDHPVLGSGLSGYESVMAPYVAGAPRQVQQPYPHNIALAGWTELGLLGMVAFMYILISLVVRPWRAFARATGFHRALLWGLGTAFVMITVHGLVDNPFWKADLSLEFWLLAALEVLAVVAVHESVASQAREDYEPRGESVARRSA
ncbi:MAG TPA: O-antigen ligase family protein [Candidatus Dormibacteraeota bacterium]